MIFILQGSLKYFNLDLKHILILQGWAFSAFRRISAFPISGHFPIFLTFSAFFDKILFFVQKMETVKPVFQKPFFWLK